MGLISIATQQPSTVPHFISPLFFSSSQLPHLPFQEGDPSMVDLGGVPRMLGLPPGIEGRPATAPRSMAVPPTSAGSVPVSRMASALPTTLTRPMIVPSVAGGEALTSGAMGQSSAESAGGGDQPGDGEEAEKEPEVGTSRAKL